jgi:hypothetical protein
MEPQAPSQGLDQLGLPAVQLDNATLRIYCTLATNQSVTVHNILADWDEMTATYNNFGGAFDPTVLGSFVATAGWRTVDVTALVQGWIDGDYPNFGLLLDQTTGPITEYVSSDFINSTPRPELVLTWDGGAQTATIKRGSFGFVDDVSILQIAPNTNFGASEDLFTGFVDNQHKQTLIKFETEVVLLAAIGDFVWFDDNHDGIQDLGEPGVPGVTVHLMDCAGNILGTDVTDANGLYLFDGLNPGNYNIHFVFPAGYSISPQDQGLNDAVDSDADITTGMTICTGLDGGETDLTWDMGIFLPDEHCTRTIGYWKTHAGFGPQPDFVTPLLPIWLGTPGGAESINVTTAQIAVDILSQDVYGWPKNGITKLLAQLLGAKLNAANDADISMIAGTIAAADLFLATHDWTDWTTLSSADKALVLGWHHTLDDYNNGLIGPIHCD